MQEFSVEHESNKKKKKKSKDNLNLSEHTGSKIAEAIQELSAKTQGNIIVRVTDKVGMYGGTFFKNSKNISRPSVQVHPYPWAALGSIIVPVCKDGNQQLHIVVVHNSRKDPQTKKYRLSEGFMHPKSCPPAKGSVDNKLAHNDSAEVLISFENIDSVKAYEKFKPVAAEKPDVNLIATAIREGREEISIELSKDQLTQVYSFDEAGQIHIYANVYLANLTKNHHELPELKTNDPEEIAEIRWIRPKDIIKTVNKEAIKFEIDGIEIPVKYATCIGFALKEFRQQEIQALGMGLITTADNLIELVKKLYMGDEKELRMLLGATPSKLFSEQVPFSTVSGIDDQQKQERAVALAELGTEAEIYHQKLMQLGRATVQKLSGIKFFEVKPFTRDEIEKLITLVDTTVEIKSEYQPKVMTY